MQEEATYSSAPELSPMELDNWRIHLLFTQSAFKQCTNLIRENIATYGPQNACALECLGMIQRLEGNVPESLDQFLMCVQLDPSSASYTKHVARSLTLLGRHEEAIDLYHEVLKQNPNDWELYYNQGLYYLFKKDLLLAEEYFLEASKHSKNVAPFEKLAEVRAECGNLPGAIEALRTAVSISPDEPDLLVKLASFYLQVGNEGAVFEQLGSALCQQPTHLHALLMTGSIMLQHADYDAALSKLRLALKNAPECASIWNNIGMALLGKRKLLGAMYCLKRAVYLEPLDWRINANLGLIYLHTNQPVSALQQITAAIHLLKKQLKGIKSTEFSSASHPSEFSLGMLYGLLAIALTWLGDEEAVKEAHAIACKNDDNQAAIPLNAAVALEKTDIQQARQYLEEAENRLRKASGNSFHFSAELVNSTKLRLEKLLTLRNERQDRNQ